MTDDQGSGESTLDLRERFTDLQEIFLEPVPRTDETMRARVLDRCGRTLDA